MDRGLVRRDCVDLSFESRRVAQQKYRYECETLHSYKRRQKNEDSDIHSTVEFITEHCDAIDDSHQIRNVNLRFNYQKYHALEKKTLRLRSILNKMNKKERLPATQMNDEFVPVYSDVEIIIASHEFVGVKVYTYIKKFSRFCVSEIDIGLIYVISEFHHIQNLVFKDDPDEIIKIRTEVHGRIERKKKMYSHTDLEKIPKIMEGEKFRVRYDTKRKDEHFDAICIEDLGMDVLCKRVHSRGKRYGQLKIHKRHIYRLASNKESPLLKDL